MSEREFDLVSENDTTTNDSPGVELSESGCYSWDGMFEDSDNVIPTPAPHSICTLY